MAHLYDDDSDDMDMGYPGTAFGQQPSSLYMQNPIPSFGAPSSAFGGMGGYGMGGYGAPSQMSGGIGFGQASKFGGIGDSGNPFGMSQPTGAFGSGGALGTDYVDLSNIKPPEIPTHQPNKYATSSKSSLKKPGKNLQGSRGVSFGDVTTFHVDKESQQTGSDKKSKSEDNDDDDEDEDDSDDDEDDIENAALTKKLAENAKKDSAPKEGKIAEMMKKMTNIDESVTDSGSLGLKKSLDSEEYKISSSHDDLAKNRKKGKDLKNQRSPTGLSDSDDNFHFKSQDLDSNKKLSSEYDSAELSRNFNYEESEDTLKNKPKSEKSKKSENDTEYDEDFEASSNLHESSSMSRVKRSSDKHDEIEDIRKRNQAYKANLESFKSGMKTPDEHEEEISKRLDSYRAKDEILEESASNSPKAEFKMLSGGIKDSKLSADEKKMQSILDRNRDLKTRSLEFVNEDLTREKYEAELQAKQFEMDAQVSRIEALNAVETNKLLKEKKTGYVQDINMYRVEIEGLKRQCDIADSNAKSKEEELNQITQEYENKLKLERERNAHSNIRQESREINELKREIRLMKAAHEQETQEKFEEVDYLTKRCEKLESENVALRVGNKAVRDAEAKAKKYEEEVHTLRMRLKEQMKSKEAQPVTGSTYNTWTKEQLVRELMNIDRAIERFTKENEALMHENKKKTAEIQELNAMLYKESQKLQDYKHKIIKETGTVMIVEDDKDLHTQVLNDLGIQHAITQKEYSELKEKLFKAEKQKVDQEQEFKIREIDYKSEIEKIREQRVEAERKLISLDSALKTQISAYDRLKEDFTNATTKLQSEKDEAAQKLDWYMENQDMLDKDVLLLKKKDERIDELKEEINTLKLKDGGRKRIVQLEKQVKDLEEALKKKHPDSIPMMLSAVKPSFEEEEAYRKLRQENEKLKKTLQEKDDEFDKKIRTLRLDIDKMKNKYDKSKAAPIPMDLKDKRIEDLERQVQETKDYYMTRLKKAEEEAKIGPNSKVGKLKEEMKYIKEIETLKKELDTLKKDKSKTDKKAPKSKNDMVLAINSLLAEDYVFAICALYKQTLSIKKSLEKSAKFDLVFKEVEDLIDEFSKASEKFRSNKATILFSKVTDK